MSVRASSRLLRQSGRLGGGGGVGLPSVGTRAASTATSSCSSSSSSSSSAADIPDSPEGTPSAVRKIKNVYNPPPLPISPLMDENKYMPISRRLPPKPQRPRGTEILSPREEALKINPYAKILATDVRNEVDFYRRLPSWFLIRFAILKHPETDQMYLVPDKIKEDSEKRQTLTAGRWAINNMELFSLIEERKCWRKLVGHDIDGSKMVWRKNMADHVLKITRERVRLETNKLQRREIVEMPWDGEGEVGCVLDWSKENGEDQNKESLTTVKGKTVPLHHMRTLLGDEIATEVQAKLRIPDEVIRSGVLLHERSLKAQMWLMRIRAYLSIH